MIVCSPAFSQGLTALRAFCRLLDGQCDAHIFYHMLRKKYVMKQHKNKTNKKKVSIYFPLVFFGICFTSPKQKNLLEIMSP